MKKHAMGCKLTNRSRGARGLMAGALALTLALSPLTAFASAEGSDASTGTEGSVVKAGEAATEAAAESASKAEGSVEAVAELVAEGTTGSSEPAADAATKKAATEEATVEKSAAEQAVGEAPSPVFEKSPSAAAIPPAEDEEVPALVPADAPAPESSAPSTVVHGAIAPTADGSAADAQGQCSLTIYYCERVVYDDPTFDDPSGLRLLEKVVVDGLNPGQTFDAWDFVKPITGYWFFDGWPRHIVISEDNSQNVLQLHYGRNTHSSCLVNYYLMRDAGATLPSANIVTDEVGGVELAFEKMGSYQIEDQPVDHVIESEALAVAADGISYLGADRDSIKVHADPARNEVNLIYMENAPGTLPDDVPVGDVVVPNAPGAGGPDAGDVTPEVPGTGEPGLGEGSGSGAGGDGSGGSGAGDSGSDGDMGGGSGENATPDAETGVGSGSGGDGSGSGTTDGSSSEESDDDAGSSNGSESAEDDENAETVISDEMTPLAAATNGVLELPQTDDGLAGTFAGLFALGTAALATAMVARRRADER